MKTLRFYRFLAVSCCCLSFCRDAYSLERVSRRFSLIVVRGDDGEVWRFSMPIGRVLLPRGL